MSTQVHGSHLVDVTLLTSAVSKGAVCLDGSPPAYFFQKGSGDGADNWLVYLEGGGWCASHVGCDQRTRTVVGSSKLRKGAAYFGQILSSDQTINPDFYNWNIVSVVYCDGSSYMGDVEGNTDIKRRGARIFDGIMEDLLAKGMKNAKNAILSGGSAGGLGAILHCDGFRALIPTASRVKCISDSGFFIHAKDLPGAKNREQYFGSITAYHLKKHYFSNDPTWRSCTSNLKVCTPTQLQTMKDFHAAMIKTLREVANSKSTGIFVHSCYRHGHFYDQGFWDNSPILGDKTIAKAIGDWYFERSPVQEIDTQNELPRNCTKHA
ncbi:UNVERIFIED_CONTAM: Pectin acetylesterase 11 [Sesamum radiatum]|uniref:Pectin acetylesterase n=1 Tax=Sesamum radiatum TaxID=300843 RepID=A0AAW2QF11_SESRA